MDDLPHPDRSLTFWAYNRNKRSVVLDIESPGGRAQLEGLLRTADIVFESFAPGYLEGIGLGYEAMAALNPRLILASLTPFALQSSDKAAHDRIADAVLSIFEVTGEVIPELRVFLDRDGQVVPAVCAGQRPALRV